MSPSRLVLLRRAETSVPSEQTLNKRELHELSSVLVGDPLRAAHALPGVAGNDDYRSEFARAWRRLRSSRPFCRRDSDRQLRAYNCGGYPDTGSLSVINADTVDSVTLLDGAFPARFCYRSASILDVTIRDGNGVKPTGRFRSFEWFRRRCGWFI